MCEGFAVEDGIEKGIIHPFSYVTAYYDTNGIAEEYSDCENKELVGQLDLAINNTPTVKDIFRKHMPNNKRKGIVFIQEITDEQNVIDIMKDVYPNVEMRIIHSKMTDEEVRANRKWFEETDEGYLLAVNMISEGAHYRGVNTLIMFRRTNSYLVFTQQIGRIITLIRNENPNAIVFDLVNNIENIEYSNRKQDKKHIHNITNIIKQLEKTTAFKSGQIIIADETRNIVKCIRKIKEFNNQRWTEEEKYILINYYKNNNKIKINVKPLLCLLPRKSKTQIINEAVFLGLSKKKISWEEQDILTLKQFYCTEGADGIIKRLPWRTRESILQLAAKCGLKYNDPNKWTEHELNILRDNYSKEKKNIIKLLPGRTWSSIQSMASKLNLSSDNRGWTEEQRRIIISEYSKLGGKKIIEKYPEIFKNKKAGALNTFAKSIGLKCSARKVVCIELGIVFDSTKNAAEYVNKSISAITIAIKEGGICGGYHWEYVE